MKQGEGEVELGEMGGYLRRDKGEEKRLGLKPGKDRKSPRRVKRDEGVGGWGIGGGVGENYFVSNSPNLTHSADPVASTPYRTPTRPSSPMSHLVCLRRTESWCDRCVSSELIHETAPRLMIRLVGV